MRADHLRNVLLIKAIEETDRSGTLIPLADRAAATRDAGRARALGRAANVAANAADGEDDADDASAEARAMAPVTKSSPRAGRSLLPASAQRLLARRAGLLRDRLIIRYPLLARLEDLAAGATWISVLILLAALAAGVAMSALDGTRRIDILALPVAGLLLWNLFVYLWVAVGAFERGGSSRILPRLYASAAAMPMRTLLTRGTPFDAPMTAALRQFATEWWECARPQVAARGARLLHLAAAALAIGLIGGLYLRGVVLRYQAGWDSTFLDLAAARFVIGILYGPASAVSGISLPTPESLAGLRWQQTAATDGASAGTDAAPWIHLIAITLVLFVVLPRLLLAALATFAQWRYALAVPLPGSVVPYFRSVFGAASGALAGGTVQVHPYAYRPAADSIAGLRTLLPAALGQSVRVELVPDTPYGEEQALVGRFTERATAGHDGAVLLFSLAATPEDENHGAVLSGVRDALRARRSPAQLLVLVDAAPWLARLGGDATLAARLDERRRLWTDFVEGHGLAACVVDLGAVRPGAEPGATASADPLARSLRAALWSAAAG